MSAPNKQPPKKAGGGASGGGGWGSIFSGAVANLESRLDTILAEDSEASARQRASEAALKEAKGRQRTGSGTLATPPAGTSRDTSRNRVNDRLAERLAKATAAKTPSRVGSPANDLTASPRASGEIRRSGEAARSAQGTEKVQNRSEVPGNVDTDASNVEERGEGQEKAADSETLLSSGLPINPARVSTESPRPSIDAPIEQDGTTPSAGGNGYTTKSTAELQTEMERMRDEHAIAEKQRQEEMHAYLEKIDALQAKLQYLAKETVAAAKEANASTSPSSELAQLAEKDERIALLMEEGEKLSKTELRHLQTIKKLRAKQAEEEKAAADVRKRVERAEKAETELKQRLRRAESAERQASAKAQQIATIESQVKELHVDREKASALIRNLTSQLKDAQAQAERADKEANQKAVEIDRKKVAALENELEEARIEKKLALERSEGEARRLKEELDRARERFGVREAELKGEIASLDSRLEAMRVRVEEVTAGAGGDGSGGSGGGEGSSVMLMRQVETLQTQYAQAKGNWEVIEGSLTARVSALEAERDEAAKRETEVRKKARESGQKSRGLEGELESAQEDVRGLSQELREQKEGVDRLMKKLEEREAEMKEAKADFERQKRLWEAEMNHRVEEEKVKSQRSARGTPSLATASPTARKASAAAVSEISGLGIIGNAASRRSSHRNSSNDLHNPHQQRPASRRSPAAYANHPYDRRPSAALDNPSSPSASLSRQPSSDFASMDHRHYDANLPPTPSIEIDNPHENEQDETADDTDTLDRASQSPQRTNSNTINDLVSTSTIGGGGGGGAGTGATGAGPSVQLVERMSAAVRRLEAEKATFKDEIARLGQQRDEARDEVVRMMRDAEAGGGKAAGGVSGAGGAKKGGVGEGDGEDMDKMRERYEASLEILGEREEEVQELKEDLAEMKRMYRELVEREMPAK
ncbi:hypothetical protein D0864_00936 [Hortaea werneckii]|uniref:TATA element modulatory factor 1 TATA binding domain-containing protein n=1 Tax=Hortaea werneckii TaxID=91943 RepID=A0A3M7HF61_HORWE|nr:hypothetical protein KC323_g5028 [Hortaea werneckii]RMZ11635.1 hypothetical protein D0864_00936 [Hortaea werneckii]